LLDGRQLSFVFQAAPAGLNAVQQGSLGGGVVQPIAGPLDIQATVTDPATRAASSLPEAAKSSTVRVTLPIPPAAQARLQQDPTAQFAWLRELRVNGEFQGYLRIDTRYDPGTGTLSYDAPLSDLTGTLFLPAFIVPAYVQNFAPGLRIWSGPSVDAIDLGEAGPQFTIFTVVAPQIGARLFVYNPASQNYGWIDVQGIGPSGPPQT